MPQEIRDFWLSLNTYTQYTIHILILILQYIYLALIHLNIPVPLVYSYTTMPQEIRIDFWIHNIPCFKDTIIWLSKCTCFLLEWFLYDSLEHEGGSVVVEGNGSDQVVLSHAGEFIINKNSLATTSSTHKHHRTTIGQEEIKDRTETDCLWCMNKHSLQAKGGQLERERVGEGS